MTTCEIEKYRTSLRVLHWVHTAAFMILFLTGLVLFIPALGFLAEGGWTRLIHRVGAVIFIIAPLIYLIISPKSVGRGLKQAFSWGLEDTGWLKAAPTYYFLCKEESMPPQDDMNTGQKMWWLLIIVFSVVFVVTGGIMWFSGSGTPTGLLQWMIYTHDISFIVTGSMLLVHVYLGVLHPMMTEAWASMAKGKMSVRYAKAHHGKWYEEITQGKKET